MNDYQRPVFRQHDVRLARNILGVKAKAKAKGMQTFAKKYLRASVLRPDAGHHPASHFLVDNVSHQASS